MFIIFYQFLKNVVLPQLIPFAICVQYVPTVMPCCIGRNRLLHLMNLQSD